MNVPAFIAWLRANWGKMVLGAVVCALLAFPFALVQPKTYQSTATLVVFPPIFKDAKPVSVTDNPEVTASVADMMPRALPVEAYKAIALSLPLVKQVIDTLGLKDVGVETLRKRLDVELIQRGSRSVQTGVMYTQTLMFHAKASSPEAAANIARTWADAFKRQVDELAKEGVGETFQLLETLHKKAGQDLEQAEMALAEHTKAWNIPLIEAQIEAKQTQITEFEGNLKQTEVDLAAAERKLAVMQDELKKETKKEVFFRAPTDDAYWTAKLEGASPKLNPDQGLRTEEINPNYVEIRTAEFTAAGEAESLRSRKDALTAKLEDLNKEIQALTVTLADKSIERDRLTLDRDSLKSSYELVRQQYEMGRMAEQTQASDIVVAGQAVVPDEPVSPRSATLVLAAAVVGAMVTGTFLFLRDLSRIGAAGGTMDWIAMTDGAAGPSTPPRTPVVPPASARTPAAKRDDSEP